MLGGADNPNGELPSYITGANKIYQSVPAYAPASFTRYHMKQQSAAFHAADAVYQRRYLNHYILCIYVVMTR